MRLLLPLLPPLLATVLGYLAYGWWGLAGGLAGALAAWAAGDAGGGRWVRSLAACLPPLVATGPTVVLVVGVFAAVLAWLRSGDERVFVFGGLAIFVPWPGASFVACACAALLLASARGPRWMGVGAGLAVASWILAPGSSPVPAALAIAAGFLARGLARHPANASVARGLVKMGILLLGVPAIAALALAAAGSLPAGFAPLALVALAAAAAGAVLLAAHAGLAALHLSDVREPAVWSALTWAPFLGVTFLVERLVSVEGSPVLAFVPLLGLTAVAFAVGVRWISRGKTRQEVPAKA